MRITFNSRFLAILFFIPQILSIIVMQLPGTSVGEGNSDTTVSVEFLDHAGNPVYILKGEVLRETAGSMADSVFLPDKLVGKKKIYKVRIKAGEGGMTLKLYSSGSTTANLLISVKTGFINYAKPIDVSFGSNSGDTVDNETINVTWLDRNNAQVDHDGGFHIERMELHVARNNQGNVVQELVFVPMAQQFKAGSSLYPQNMMGSMYGAGAMPAGAVPLQPPPPAVGVFLQPPPQQQQPGALYAYPPSRFSQ